MIPVTNSGRVRDATGQLSDRHKTFEPPSLAAQVPATAVFPGQVGVQHVAARGLNLGAPQLQGPCDQRSGRHFCARSPSSLPQGIKIPAYCKWAQTYPNGQSVVIPAQGNPNLVVQNSLICNPPIDLSITKAGPDPVPGAPGLFTFTMTVTSPGGPFTIQAVRSR